MIWTGKNIIEATGAKLINGSPGAGFVSISTDTRTVGNRELFVALVGDIFDGHDFIQGAVAKGAGGILVKSGYEVHPNLGDIPILEVDDTLFALAEGTVEFGTAGGRRVINVVAVEA